LRIFSLALIQFSCSRVFYDSILCCLPRIDGAVIRIVAGTRPGHSLELSDRKDRGFLV
jgi:hypothetical protein